MSQPVALQSSAGGGGVSAPSPSGDTSRPQMEKAALKLYDATPSGLGGRTRTRIPFQFNPKEVTIQKAAKWERKTAKGAKKAGPPEFSGSEPCKLTLEMFFDATGKQDGSVVEAVEQLFSCTVPTEESAGQKKPSPPLVVLHWGAITSFPAFVTSVSAKYTLFTADGLPIRALCSVALEEMPSEPAQAEPDLRQRRRPPLPHRRRGRLARLGRLRRVRRPRRPGGTSPGSTGSTTRSAACPAPGSCSRHPRSSEPMSFTNTFLVEIDGTALPADIAPLLIAALVDDSQQYPDLFELRFRDPAHLVLPKSGAKVGSAVKISVSTSDSKAPLALMTGEVTALQSEFDSGGTFTVLRGYDAAHRLFRGRRTEALHADDRLRHRPEGGPAGRAPRPATSPAPRPSTSTCPRPAPATGT